MKRKAVSGQGKSSVWFTAKIRVRVPCGTVTEACDRVLDAVAAGMASKFPAEDMKGVSVIVQGGDDPSGMLVDTGRC
jgi:hypothetical protein